MSAEERVIAVTLSFDLFNKLNFDNLKSSFEAGIYWCCVSECRGESYSSLILLWRDTSDWVGSFTESTLTLTSFYIDPLIPTPRASIRNHWTITMRNISTFIKKYIQKNGCLGHPDSAKYFVFSANNWAQNPGSVKFALCVKPSKWKIRSTNLRSQKLFFVVISYQHWTGARAFWGV